ncbi:MAG: ankyrin repeat domain-containing protein [Verrucomicrobia bacterium]|nr:ankyrin repeat domain-containing protein [Verrucomicrobiota bacterium]MBT6803472.1 ankyrin repeat domain-containing protein [Verrucomicrobiota bacterium]
MNLTKFQTLFGLLASMMLIGYGKSSFPLHEAAVRGDIDSLEKLLKAGSDVNIQDGNVQALRGISQKSCVSPCHQKQA